MQIPKIQVRRYPQSQRRGTTVVESAVILATCLFLLFGMLDLSVAIVRYTLMSEAARRIARAAIVHGNSASASQGQWGPASVATNGASSNPAALVIRDMLLTLDPADVSITVVWPDGDNRPDQRVQVTVRYTHHPVVSIPGWYSHIELLGASTMRIAH